MDFKDLIGLKVDDAKKVLNNFGYNDIEEVINSKTNDQTDTLMVCAVRHDHKKVILVLGEFFLNVKEI